MNSVFILILVVLWLFLGYRIYGRFLEKRLKINDKNKTPAVTVRQKGKIDFSPASKPFLFGHHFASIAGAGPIIGPILAVSYFGWLPVVLWASIGSVFLGAMHDFVNLIASVRNKAKGVSNIAKEFLSSKAGIVFGVMILITLILIITVFSVSSAQSIINKPGLVIPLISITIISIVLGFGVEKLKWSYKWATTIAIVLVFASLWAGIKYPIDFSFMNPALLKNILITVIMLYAGIASVVPVWILLRPRDYLSAIQMLMILSLGLIGVLIIRPNINAPAYISGGTLPLWPILFITVACGAISGFHALVSSGTTSKQLSRESHAKPIAYGGMLLEGLLAVLVTIFVVAGLKWGASAGENSFQVMLDKGWIFAFSSGFGNIVGSIGIPLLTASLAGLLGAFMVNQFILTSVDTSTRLSRFIISENLAEKLKSKFKNRFIITILILIPAWLLAITNSYETLWRLFGSSNQLIAAIALITVSSYLVSKKIKVRFIIIPALLVLVTTVFSLLYLTFRAGGYLSEGNWALIIISIILVIFALVVSWEGFRKLRKKK